MIITIDTEQPVSNIDRAMLDMLRVLLDSSDDAIEGYGKVPAEPTPPAKKPAPKRKTAPAPDTSILEQAVARAMELVTAKQGNLVKAALTAAGAPTAKALTMENVGTFMEALDNNA